MDPRILRVLAIDISRSDRHDLGVSSSDMFVSAASKVEKSAACLAKVEDVTASLVRLLNENPCNVLFDVAKQKNISRDPDDRISHTFVCDDQLFFKCKSCKPTRRHNGIVQVLRVQVAGIVEADDSFDQSQKVTVGEFGSLMLI